MLFNSLEFIFLYLPVALTVFAWLAHRGNPIPAVLWLALASYVFYGWTEPPLVALLAASTAFNYGTGLVILRARNRGLPILAYAAMAFGVAGNLLLLGYFKYADFFMGVTAELTGNSWTAAKVALPIGISFFTFTQIAFLVDAARGEVRSMRLGDYFLFVSYFPHLVAGPILHHKDMIPQFAAASSRSLCLEPIATGLSIFAVGLFKKTILADNVAPIADRAFKIAAENGVLEASDAWVGALAYTMQIYFDFSGYSDMAVGLSLMFGIKLPINFNSPYKSTSIIDFWTRWHITLSQFLRDYLYIPLGGNRRGTARRYVNLMLTMLLGGLWHGAGWTFVVWGAVHGVYLAINHAMRRVRPLQACESAFSLLVKRLCVFVAVVIAWVFFRADTLGTAGAMLKAMAGLNGFGSSPAGDVVCWLAGAMAIAWLMPNTYQIFGRYETVLPNPRSPLKPQISLFNWRGGMPSASALGLIFVVAVLAINQLSPFLYFRF